VKQIICIFSVLLFSGALLFAAPSPGGKASFRSLPNDITTLGVPEVSDGVSAPYPTNKWFGSAYIYYDGRKQSDAQYYNTDYSFKMAPRPLTFTTLLSVLSPGDGGKGYYAGVENIKNIGNDVIANLYGAGNSYISVYDIMVSAKKVSNNSAIFSSRTKLDGYSDWAATFVFQDSTTASAFMKTTIGRGFIFTYNTFSDGVKPFISEVAHGGDFTFFDRNLGTHTSGSITDDAIILRVKHSDKTNYYGIYTSSGAQFNFAANDVTIVFRPGAAEDERIVSIGLLLSVDTAPDLLPQDNLAKTIFDDYYHYAYNFITNTSVSYSFNQNSSKLETSFNFTLQNKRASDSSYTQRLPGTVAAVYPHQYNAGAMAGYNFETQNFQGLRGTLKVLKGITSFKTEYVFNGVLPNLTFEIPDDKTAKLQEYINSDKNFDPGSGSQDTYYAGKFLSKAANLIPVLNHAASYDQSNAQNRDNMINKLKTQLQTWYGGQSSAKYFGYNSQDSNRWGGIIGVPYSFGSENYNDHNFHYGYFVYASAILAMFDPDFAKSSEYKGMVDLLVKDYANPPAFSGVNDPNFPTLRNFDVYEGHSWASGDGGGSGVFGDDGINQESSSEAMNSWAAVILWGMVTNNQKFIDLGIYGYVTEYSAVREYYFDTSAQNFAPYAAYGYNSVGILFENSVRYNVLWRYPYSGTEAANPPKSQELKGIQVLPLTPAMLYLGYDTTYAQNFYNQTFAAQTPPIQNDLSWWKGVWLRFKALFNSTPNAVVSEFETSSMANDDDGSSSSFSYHWIHFFNSLGNIDTNYYADYPAFLVMNKNGVRTFIAYNPDKTAAKAVKFYERAGSGAPPAPNGGTVVIPAGTLISTKDFKEFKYDGITYMVQYIAPDSTWNVILTAAPSVFSSDPNLSITQALLPSVIPVDISYAGQAFNVAASLPFNSSASLTIDYSGVNFPATVNQNDLRLAYINASGEFEIIDTAPLNGTKIISTLINKPGDYALVQSAKTAKTSVYAYPNPYKASRHGSSGIIFDNTYSGDRIRIYTIAGEKVYDKIIDSNNFKWDIVNNSDYYLASGIYVYFIESQGKIFKGKVAVER
jgi:endoglucanase Acf2